jgi:polo-like kinase 1
LLRGPSVWIKKWVDYSSKYGLGYLLSNNATGVFFNDSTKIVLDQASQGQNGKNFFYYYERKPISATEKQDVMTTHSLLEYPKELQKKVTLLQHFRSYLENNAQTNGSGTNGPTSGKSANIDSDVEMRDETTQKMANSGGPIVYVKKWMRTKHAIMFRLSNKIVQVSFQDHTEILLNSESRLVTYVNKKGER